MSDSHGRPRFAALLVAVEAGRYRVAAANAGSNLIGALGAVGLAWLLVAALGRLTG